MEVTTVVNDVTNATTSTDANTTASFNQTTQSFSSTTLRAVKSPLPSSTESKNGYITNRYSNVKDYTFKMEHVYDKCKENILLVRTAF